MNERIHSRGRSTQENHMPNCEFRSTVKNKTRVGKGSRKREKQKCSRYKRCIYRAFVVSMGRGLMILAVLRLHSIVIGRPAVKQRIPKHRQGNTEHGIHLLSLHRHKEEKQKDKKNTEEYKQMKSSVKAPK